MPLFDIKLENGDVMKVEHPQAPTLEEAQALIATLPPAPTAAVSPAIGRLAPSRFTPLQLGALNVGIGPLASLIGSQLSGRPVTATEAAAEGALEQLGKIPGEIAPLALQGLTPPAIRTMATLGEAAGVLPKNSLSTLINRLVNPLVQAPAALATSLDIEQGSERAKFREPTAAALGEVGTALINPIVEETKVAETVGRLPGAIRNTVEKMSARGITRAPLEDAVTRATGITAQEGSLELAPIIKTKVLEVGGRPTTAQGALKAADKASENVIGKALNGMEKAETQGLAFVGDSAREAGRQQILFDFPSLKDTPDEVETILSSFDYLSGNIKPTQGQGFLRELNSKYLGLENKNTPEASAYRAVRTALSNQLDDVYKAATGVNDSPYRQWGSLQDFRSGVSDQIIASQRVQGGKAEKGVTRVPTTRGTTKRIAEAVGLRALIPREIEAVDKGIQRIFSSEVESLGKPVKLTPAELQTLRDKYLAKPPVQVPPVPAEVSAASNLEQAIQKTIQSLPRNMRGANERAIAEAIVRSQAP